jgi:hypothetical protein
LKVLNIKISALPPENNSFWMRLLFYLCIPFLFIFGILLLIGWGIYSGISSIISAVKEDFFGIKDKTNIKISKNILFENEQFKLKKEDYLPDENSQEYKIFDDFCVKSNEYLDDGYIFYKLTDEKSATDLNGAIISEFQENIGNYILLQNLILEDNQLKNQLISFDKNTGKMRVLADIKDFFWLEFDSETKTINGYNNKEQIEIAISE